MPTVIVGVLSRLFHVHGPEIHERDVNVRIERVERHDGGYDRIVNESKLWEASNHR